MMEILAYTPTTLAEAMHASRPTVYRWMRIPGFPVVRLGGCVRIPVKAFEQWLNEQSGVKIDNEGQKRKRPRRCGNTDKGDGKRFGDHTFPSKEYHSDAKKATYF